MLSTHVDSSTMQLRHVKYLRYRSKPFSLFEVYALMQQWIDGVIGNCLEWRTVFGFYARNTVDELAYNRIVQI